MPLLETKLLFVLGSIFIFGLLENIIAFYDYKKSWKEKVYTNFSLGIFNSIITNFTIVLILAWTWQQTYWDGLLVSISSTEIKFILSFLILDVYMYFWHRLMHKTKFGWNLHKIHHTDLSVNSSSAYRFHIFEIFLSNIPKIFLVLVLGISIIHYFIYEIIFTVIIIFHHSNWALNKKIDYYLSIVIVTPNLHRVHHSIDPVETHSNYSSVFIIWDKIFGSFKFKHNTEELTLGLPQFSSPLKFLELLKLPLKNYRKKSSIK